jgi:hypothetical protein
LLFGDEYLTVTTSNIGYYHARYYDPVLGRFISPDTLVPGTEAHNNGRVATVGRADDTQLAPLTVDFQNPAFAAVLADEHRFMQEHGWWFALDAAQRQELGTPWGPQNPQALNRYSYVLNNPLRYTDPSGYWTFAVNIGFDYFVFGGGRVSGSIAIDTSGNIGLLTSGGVTVHSTAGSGFGVSGTVTNASTINDLAGASGAIGVNLGEGGVVAVEGETFVSNGQRYYGGTLGGSAQLQLLPFEVYGAVDNTTILGQGNPVKALQYVYEEGERQIRRLYIDY